MKLEKEKILVIGAGGGIGTAVVDTLLSDGAEVVAADLVRPASNSMHNIVCDVTNSESIDSAVAEVVERIGGITGVAYVAGLLHDASPIDQFDFEVWDRVFDINVKGIVRMAHAVVPIMRSSGGGRIVNVASWWGRSGHAFFSAYCASKSSVISLTQSMAEELASAGIRVNAVAPGNIDTSMHRNALETEAKKRGLSPEEMKEIEWEKIPLGFAGPPHSIADAIAFLLSDRSSYITGATIDVNGGVLFH